MFKLDKSLTKPMYQQIIDSIIDRIQHGQLRYGDSLPGEEQCHRIYGISSVIVKKAYGELRRQGYITRQQGLGTKVSYLPQLTIDLNSLPNLVKLNQPIVPHLLLKDKSTKAPYLFHYVFVFYTGSLVIAYQEIETSMNVGSYDREPYSMLISKHSIINSHNQVEAKLADSSLAFILGIADEDAITVVKNNTVAMRIKSYLRSDIIQLTADAYGN